MSQSGFLKYTDYDQLTEKHISKFRKLIYDFSEYIREATYYYAKHEPNLDISAFEKINKEIESTINEILYLSTISAVCDKIHSFLIHFNNFSEYFEKVQNEFFDSLHSSINELIENDESLSNITNINIIRVDCSPPTWEELLKSLKIISKTTDTSQICDKIDCAYALSMIHDSIENIEKFYDEIPDELSKDQLKDLLVSKDCEIEKIKKENEEKLSKKDKIIDELKQDQKSNEKELQNAKEAYNNLEKKYSDQKKLANDYLAQKQALVNENEKLLKEISDLKTQLQEFQENPPNVFDIDKIMQIKNRYLSVLEFVKSRATIDTH